jgi:predicted alpha/beta-fold hydrolase
VLHSITLPTLILHAWDDPFIRILPSTMDRIRANPALQFVGTEHGGHCGFLEQGKFDDGRWAERECVSFLLHAHHHAHSHLSGRLPANV